MSTPQPPLPGEEPGSGRPFVVSSLTDTEAKWATAFHEAGHAVVDALWGLNVIETRIYQVPMENGIPGTGHTGDTRYGDSALPWVVGLAHGADAGNLAARLYLQTIGRWNEQTARLPDTHHDRVHAEQKLTQIGFTMHTGSVPPGVHGGSWEVVHQQVEQTLLLLWPQVSEVARGLYESGQVSGDRVRSILDGAPQLPDLVGMVLTGQTEDAQARLTALAQAVAAASKARIAHSERRSSPAVRAATRSPHHDHGTQGPTQGVGRRAP